MALIVTFLPNSYTNIFRDKTQEVDLSIRPFRCSILLNSRFVSLCKFSKCGEKIFSENCNLMPLHPLLPMATLISIFKKFEA